MPSETRARIVTATNELFRLKGYSATTLAEISAAAEAPTGSIYHFFPGGKVELTEAVVRETGHVYRELFLLIAAGHPDPAEAIEAFFVAAAETLEASDFLDPCPIGGIGREVACVDERLRTAVARVFESWVDAVAATLTATGMDDETAGPLARSAISLLEGGFTVARVLRDGDVLRRSARHARAMIAAADRPPTTAVAPR